MPVVLVHGVPETAEVWKPLRAHLDREAVALSLPGFGVSRPPGFASTKEEYVAWLIAEIEKFGERVDLVGHDWGGVLAVRVASLRSDLLRSWASDALTVGNRDHRWHRFARIWQTPGEGEEWVRRHLAAPVERRSALMQSYGIPPEDADRLVGWFDQEMGDAILRLYRSATSVGAEWAGGLTDVAAPGLALIPTEDPFSHHEHAAMAAERAGARVIKLNGLGHWWMLEDPDSSARVLEEFWSQPGVD